MALTRTQAHGWAHFANSTITARILLLSCKSCVEVNRAPAVTDVQYFSCFGICVDTPYWLIWKWLGVLDLWNLYWHRQSVMTQYAHVWRNALYCTCKIYLKQHEECNSCRNSSRVGWSIRWLLMHTFLKWFIHLRLKCREIMRIMRLVSITGTAELEFCPRSVCVCQCCGSN